MNKQIFGYTPLQTAGDSYVKFCAVLVNEDGDIIVNVRNNQGIINEIVLPHATAAELGAALSEYTKPGPTV